MSQHEHQQSVVSVDNSAFFFKVPKKYFWHYFLVMCFLGYNPVKDVVTSQLPMRGNESLQASRANVDLDNQRIFNALEALNNGRVSNSNGIYMLGQLVVLHYEQQRDFQTDVKNNFREVNSRLDKLVNK